MRGGRQGRYRKNYGEYGKRADVGIGPYGVLMRAAGVEGFQEVEI